MNNTNFPTAARPSPTQLELDYSRYKAKIRNIVDSYSPPTSPSETEVFSSTGALAPSFEAVRSSNEPRVIRIASIQSSWEGPWVDAAAAKGENLNGQIMALMKREGLTDDTGELNDKGRYFEKRYEEEMVAEAERVSRCRGT